MSMKISRIAVEYVVSIIQLGVLVCIQFYCSMWLDIYTLQ